MPSILFVCLGNICRSPTAEGVFRHVLAREAPELAIDIDSAGTADYHSGSPPDVRSRSAAAARGIDLSKIRARQVNTQDFDRFDLVLAMDQSNLHELRSRMPRSSRATLRLFLEYAGPRDEFNVPDPYNGGPEDFERVLDLTTLASHGLLAALRAGSTTVPRR